MFKYALTIFLMKLVDIPEIVLQVVMNKEKMGGQKELLEINWDYDYLCLRIARDQQCLGLGESINTKIT